MIKVAALAVLTVPSACMASEPGLWTTFKAGVRGVVDDARPSIEALQDEGRDMGLVTPTAGYYGRKAVKATGEAFGGSTPPPRRPNGPSGPSWWSYYSIKARLNYRSFMRRYKKGTLKWNDTECLVLEGVLATIVLYAGYKIYKRVTREKDPEKPHDKDGEKTN